MDFGPLDERPVVVAVAGPNGAGKTTFFETHLSDAGLPFLNADLLSAELGLAGYGGASIAAALRQALLDRGESFVFETVFSDPVGEKMGFLRDAATEGYTVILIFIGLSDPDISEERVAMRVSQGGHDVPVEKIPPRFGRSLENLRLALRALPHVLVYDNDDLRNPYRQVAIFRDGAPVFTAQPLPAWLHSVLPSA